MGSDFPLFDSNFCFSDSNDSILDEVDDHVQDDADDQFLSVENEKRFWRVLVFVPSYKRICQTIDAQILTQLGLGPCPTLLCRFSAVRK